MTKTMHLSRLVALAGSILTLVQILFYANDSDGICFNAGCEIVDSLTTVPPVFFNIGGFLFFQAIFWGIWLAGKQQQRSYFVNILLLAAIAAEAVLVSFQYFIAQVFCSYCLIVFSLVVLLNILGGLRQTIGATAVFAAVIIGFFSLQFSGVRGNLVENLDRGTYALLDGKGEGKNYLFFSSTCRYCENVIEFLPEENECPIRFNPIDIISHFPLENVEKVEGYTVEVNKNFLQSMGLDQIPILLAGGATGFQVIKGEGPIKKYLQETCFKTEVAPASSPAPVETIGTTPAAGFDFLAPPQDDGCSVFTDCDEPPSAE